MKTQRRVAKMNQFLTGGGGPQEREQQRTPIFITSFFVTLAY